MNFWMTMPQYWNHYNSLAPRTTNSVEGWHSKLNKKFNKCHPNVWTLLQVLKDEVSEVEQKLTSFSTGHPLKKPALKYRKANRMLRNLTERYIEGAISSYELAEGASNLY